MKVDPDALRARDDRPTIHRMCATPGLTIGKRSKTLGSWPGTMSRGFDASVRMRSCARRFDAASSVCEMGTWRSRFSYRYALSDARTTVPASVRTAAYCDWKVCLPPV